MRCPYQEVGLVLCVVLLLAKHILIEAEVAEKSAGVKAGYEGDGIRRELHAVQSWLVAA